jgi:hypothetical protein
MGRTPRVPDYFAGRSELNMSRIIFQLPSGSFLQTLMNLPTSSIGLAPFG